MKTKFCSISLALLIATGLAARKAARDPRARLSVSTPVEAAEFLRQHPQLAQHGVLLNTYELGDYLIWALHPRFRVMVASHAHLIPPDVWQDYIAISQRQPGWPARIEKYNLRVAVLNTRRHRQVIRDLVNEHRWQIAFRGRSASVVIHPDVTWP